MWSVCLEHLQGTTQNYPKCPLIANIWLAMQLDTNCRLRSEYLAITSSILRRRMSTPSGILLDMTALLGPHVVGNTTYEGN